DIGVGHQHDLVVAKLGFVEVVVDAGSERGDDRLYFLVLQDAVDPSLFDVEDLSANRQNRLEAWVATTLGRTTGGVALHDEKLAFLGVGRLTVSQLAGQT